MGLVPMSPNTTPSAPIMRLARAGSEAFASADAIGTTPSLARGSFMAFPCSFFRIREATRKRPIAWLDLADMGIQRPDRGQGSKSETCFGGRMFNRSDGVQR